MMKNIALTVSLLAPLCLDEERILAFVESALKTESGFYEPEEPERQIKFVGVKKTRKAK